MRSAQSQPCGAPKSAAPEVTPSVPCELCGQPVWPGPYTREVFDASDTWACNDCIEDMLA